MYGGARKRGKNWYYYSDAGKINGKRNKIERPLAFLLRDAPEAYLSQRPNSH